MDAGARETENALKKELAEVKDQVTTIKERTAEVHHGECLVHHCEAASYAAMDKLAYCRACSL
jgi:hypothetical protein